MVPAVCCLLVRLCFVKYPKMYALESFILNLQELLIRVSYCDSNIIRKHSRKLQQQGDISFPLNIKNWYHLLDTNNLLQDMGTIFDYNLSRNDLDTQIEELKEKSKSWQITVGSVMVNDNDVHLFLERSSCLLKIVLTEVINKSTKYGSTEIIDKNLTLNCDHNIDETRLSEMDLSTLRLFLLRDVTLNLLAITTKVKTNVNATVVFTVSSSNKSHKSILCGPVLNEKGVKDNTTTSEDLFNKRTSDMRMMAQHKYGVQVKSNASWESYFNKLGRAAVTIEMLSNKPHKALKLTMNDLQTANKGASFIFYNCARLTVLFKEFQKKVERNVYPNLPEISKIDFALLNQPEEWELFFVYILQYPAIIKNCIKDIEKGILNPQYLVSFLSSLSSVFSIYYRRVRILTDPREHLFPVLHARVYLLRALQCVFHNALDLLNIEPVKEM